MNVARIRRIPALLAGLLVGLALVTLVHSSSCRSTAAAETSRPPLGADGGWIGRAVHSQATVLTIVPLLVGIPLGLLAGSVIFRAFVDRIGALRTPPSLSSSSSPCAPARARRQRGLRGAGHRAPISTSQLLHEE